MRHRKAGKQLSRNTSHRKAMLRNITTSLLMHERIETTHVKAKAVRPIAEKMITLAKKGDLHARRQALAYIQDKSVGHKLFDELKDRFSDKQGGYVRITQKGVRKGDGAPMSIVQLIPKEEEKKPVKKRTGKPKTLKTQGPKNKKTEADVTEASVPSHQPSETVSKEAEKKEGAGSGADDIPERNPAQPENDKE